jgi:hypothetical protein
MRLSAIPVVILLVLCGRVDVQAQSSWNFFGSGTTVQSDKGMRIVSILGATFVGSASAGSVVHSTGFGTYVAAKGVASAIYDPGQSVPAVYSLSQNYPNPFNPSTTIEYGLPYASRVQLTVFDVLGRIVATLQDGEHAAGSYRLRWNAPLSTGVYFYRIDATSLQNSQRRLLRVMKMLFVK